MDIEELAFKNHFELKYLQKIDLLLIIDVLQKDRKKWIEQFAKTHNEGVQLQRNWNELKKWLEEEMLEYKKVKYSSEYGYAIGTMSKTLKKMQELGKEN